MDGRRTDDGGFPYYKLPGAFGSGELKIVLKSNCKPGLKAIYLAICLSILLSRLAVSIYFSIYFVSVNVREIYIRSNTQPLLSFYLSIYLSIYREMRVYLQTDRLIHHSYICPDEKDIYLFESPAFTADLFLCHSIYLSVYQLLDRVGCLTKNSTTMKMTITENL